MVCFEYLLNFKLNFIHNFYQIRRSRGKKKAVLLDLVAVTNNFWFFVTTTKFWFLQKKLGGCGLDTTLLHPFLPSGTWAKEGCLWDMTFSWQREKRAHTHPCDFNEFPFNATDSSLYLRLLGKENDKRCLVVMEEVLRGKLWWGPKWRQDQVLGEM